MLSNKNAITIAEGAALHKAGVRFSLDRAVAVIEEHIGGAGRIVGRLLGEDVRHRAGSNLTTHRHAIRETNSQAEIGRRLGGQEKSLYDAKGIREYYYERRSRLLHTDSMRRMPAATSLGSTLAPSAGFLACRIPFANTVV